MQFHQTTTNKYLLYILLFNTINCLAMLNPLQNGGNGINNIIYQPYAIINQNTQKPTSSTFINQYWEEHTKDTTIYQQVIAIRDILDKQLGVDTTSFFRRLTGSVKSYSATTFLSQQQINQKMNDIESHVMESSITKEASPDTKKEIFKILLENHWYVHYLVQASVQKEVKKFEKATCSTLEQLLNPDFSNDIIGIKKLIYDQAREIFINEKGLNNPLERVPYDRSGDIHFTVLYGDTHQIQSQSMIMSTDGKYLKATDVNDLTLTWDIIRGILILFPAAWDETKGKTTTEIPQDIKWKSGYVPKYMHDCTMDETNNYAAFNIHGSGLLVGKNYEPRSLAEMGTSAFPVEINDYRSAIIIFKRPTLQSYLYQQIFTRNINDLKQLSCLYQLLHDFTIEDFPRKNLKRLIFYRIQHLTQPQDSQAKL